LAVAWTMRKGEIANQGHIANVSFRIHHITSIYFASVRFNST
jgi:hypothetical protein